MKKICFIFFIIAFSFLIVGCSEEEEPLTTSTSHYENLTINSTLTNEANGHKYDLYFVLPDTLTSDASTNDDIEKVGPIESNDNMQYRISMQLNWDLYNLIDKSNNRLQAVIVESSDIYLLNPLNEKTLVEFIKNDDETTKDNYEYYSKESNIDVDFTDGYPDGVLSLHYPDAMFVVKLQFADGYINNNSNYEVGIMPTHNTKLTMVSMMTGPSKYYEVAFSADDKLNGWKGNIIINNPETGEEVVYKDYPKKIEFDKNGKCKEGDIITVTIEN